MVLGVQEIEDMYDIPTPTRLSPWGEKRQKAPKRGTHYQDPFPQPMSGKALYQGVRNSPTNAKKVAIIFPSGDEKQFDSVGHAAREVGCNPSTIRGIIKRTAPTYAAYSGRYIDGR